MTTAALRNMLWGAAAAALAVGGLLPMVSSFAQGAALVLAAVCLLLWLSEAVPMFVPALLLAVLVPALLGRHDADYRLDQVLSWGADPVVALFFGGFVLSAAISAHGLDQLLVQRVVQLAGSSALRLFILVTLLTAFLSMWVSNTAAAALVLASLQPLLNQLPGEAGTRRALLLGVAFGADFGGMATPIGTGPNGLAMAQAAELGTDVSFSAWMVFALPLTLGLLLAAIVLVAWRCGLRQEQLPTAPPAPGAAVVSPRRNQLLLVLGLTVLLWLTEPWHGIPTAGVALGAAAVLFATGLVVPATLRELDWGTLLLIAGGLMLGRLLEQSGVVRTLAGHVDWAALPSGVGLVFLCMVTATLSALMSNTAAVVMLLPLSQVIYPAPSTAIVVALAASMGVPFVISTPPNALAYSKGGLRTTDLLLPGLLLMIGGCLLISLTGKSVLNLVGIP
ncbi:SLC13 family permease [Hymenobacter koreensis]|uniref:Citrate transporter-like domain-containing protein n=1 Tax=Hymenobacter koreensis TaxID=1084523 RepID=A0ABP8JFE9_9BACT